MKLTPWFPNSIKPVRVGVYQIRGASFCEPNYRYWDGVAWSYTRLCPEAFDCDSSSPGYAHGEDMTGWRGIKK